jgi:hypothetical protein
MEVDAYVAGGDPDVGGTSPRVSLVSSAATVRHSCPLPLQHGHQTACRGELCAVKGSKVAPTAQGKGYGVCRFSFPLQSFLLGLGLLFSFPNSIHRR